MKQDEIIFNDSKARMNLVHANCRKGKFPKSGSFMVACNLISMWNVVKGECSYD